MKHEKEDFFKRIINGCNVYGINTNSLMLENLYSYYELLYEKSTETNLISRNDLSRFVEYHILDSLKTVCCFDYGKDIRILDFGSGCGIPGIPLAISFPSTNTVLIDSRKLRCDFLSTVSSVLDNLKISVVCSTIESYPEIENQTFDLIITRATVKLFNFFKISRRFLKPGGSLIAIKGESYTDELHLLKKHVDLKVFNIETHVPTFVEGVRNGVIVKITQI
jgi:16S rRNA (guanine527-N7)-methyltransferase